MSVEFLSDQTGREDEIVALVTESFTAAEGAEEGALIEGYTRDILTRTAREDLRVFSAVSDSTLVGCILFTRLWYPDDGRKVFILSPVAVSTALQGQGIGQALLSHGLDALRQEGVDFVTTYGDPGYYQKVGFTQIPETFAKAPLPMSYPEGWLGQFLNTQDKSAFMGQPKCVDALNRADIW